MTVISSQKVKKIEHKRSVPNDIFLYLVRNVSANATCQIFYVIDKNFYNLSKNQLIFLQQNCIKLK